MRAYSGLRSSDRELALRAWLYRIAHNRCIDELRRPQSVATETIPATVPNAGGDPVVRLEQRDALKRLIADVQRLPDQQRSALLMRELAGMTYADVAGALGVSVPAVKSLLVRARVGLAQANEARDTSCARIREDLIVSHDRGVRASGLARRHLRDCPHCRQFRSEVRGVSRQLAGFVPALGPIGVIAKVLGIGGGGGAAAGTGAIAGSGATPQPQPQPRPAPPRAAWPARAGSWGSARSPAAATSSRSWPPRWSPPEAPSSSSTSHRRLPSASTTTTLPRPRRRGHRRPPRAAQPARQLRARASARRPRLSPRARSPRPPPARSRTRWPPTRRQPAPAVVARGRASGPPRSYLRSLRPSIPISSRRCTGREPRPA